MFATTLHRLARRTTSSLRPLAGRSVTFLLLCVLSSTIVSAYTIVLKSGRHLEIPSQFTVTPLTVTYEASPGINVTILMSIVDIAATERANNEADGAFLARANTPQRRQSSQPAVRTGRRQLSQSDVEAAKIERAKSQQEYERRRKELGLPSMEEARIRTELETQRLVELSRQTEADEIRSEEYWRSRASSLRTGMAALDGEIRYLRRRLSELPDYSRLENYTFIGYAAPGFHNRRPVTIFPEVSGHPGFMRGTSDTRSAGPGLSNITLATNTGSRRFDRGFARVRTGHPFLGSGLGIGLSPFNYELDYERAGLTVRLRELESARAGLEAQWRLLEEEARRAGAQPGWLRP